MQFGTEFQSVHEVSADEDILVETVHPDVIEDNDDAAELTRAILRHCPSGWLPSLVYATMARRMLQWKRMGFDLSTLEPALDERYEQARALCRGGTRHQDSH